MPRESARLLAAARWIDRRHDRDMIPDDPYRSLELDSVETLAWQAHQNDLADALLRGGGPLRRGDHWFRVDSGPFVVAATPTSPGRVLVGSVWPSSARPTVSDALLYAARQCRGTRNRLQAARMETKGSIGGGSSSAPRRPPARDPARHAGVLGHALPGLPAYRYRPLNGDSFGFYSATREFIASLGRVSGPLLGSCVRGRHRRVARGCPALAWWLPGTTGRRVLLPAAAVSLALTLPIHQMEPPGAAVFGWPLLWAIPMIPIRPQGSARHPIPHSWSASR